VERLVGEGGLSSAWKDRGRIGDGDGIGEGMGVDVPTILPLDHILRVLDTLLVAHINLQQLHFPRQFFSLELFHSGFAFLSGATAEEDEVFGVFEELGGEGETDAAICWDDLLVGA